MKTFHIIRRDLLDTPLDIYADTLAEAMEYARNGVMSNEMEVWRDPKAQLMPGIVAAGDQIVLSSSFRRSK